MVRMTVRDVDIARGRDEVELVLGWIALEPPTAPVHGTDEPWVCGQQRPTVFEQEQSGVTQGVEFETRQLKSRLR